MRLALCTKRDLFGCMVLNRLLPRLRGHELLVLLSDKTRPAEQDVPELAELKLLERDLPLGLLFPLCDRLSDNAPALTFKRLAQRHEVAIHTVQQINTGDGAALLDSFEPDLILSARFSHIFKPPLIDRPRFGIYNVHPGALPRYAGLFAPMRGLLAGETQLGCTLHRMDDGIDSGPIYGIRYLPVNLERSLFWHVAGIYPLGLDMFDELLGRLERGEEVPLQVQDPASREYRSMPTAADFAAFRAAGGRLVTPDEYIENLSAYFPA